MEGFMGYSPAQVFLVFLLFVIVAVLIYRNYNAQDETGVVRAPEGPYEEEREREQESGY